MQTKRLDDQDVLALEEVVRDRARTNYLAFIRYTFPAYRTNWHHRVIAEALEKFISGETKRLIISAPPQAGGKSELVSRRLPPFILGRFPTKNILAGSYTADLIQTMSRATQRVMESEQYHELFPEVRLGGRFKKTDEEFETPQGGAYKCAGMGGGITGRPADYAILDDILKGRRDANSPTIRKNAWEWLQDEVFMRLGAHGGCLLMSTRWHLDDPAGRILKQQAEDTTSERWEHICLPARLDREEDRMKGDPRAIGDPLWTWYYAGKPGPEKNLTTDQQLEKAKEFLSNWESRNPYGFASLAQQQPVPIKGEYFDVEKFKIVDQMVGKRLKTTRYWDKAASEDKTAKRTAGVKMSKWLLNDGTQAICVEDSRKGRWAPGRREEEMRRIAALDGKDVIIVVEEEGGSGGVESAENTVKSLRGFRVKRDKPRGDKALRAEPFASQVNGGVVYMMRGDWNLDYTEELRNFSPAASLKDQVDASSGAFCELDKGGNWRALLA